MTADYPPGLDDLLGDQEHVLHVGSALRYMSRGALRWQVDSGRWQQPCHGVVVAHSGPMTEQQRLRAAVMWAGPSRAPDPGHRGNLDALGTAAADWPALDQTDTASVAASLQRISDVIGERRRYLKILA